MTINIDDKEIYGIVAQEMASNIIDSGLMAKALAEADFDDNRSKAMYLKMRVADLKAQQVQQQNLLEKQKSEEQNQRAHEKDQIKKQLDINNKKLEDKKLYIFISALFGLSLILLIFILIIDNKLYFFTK